MLLRLIKIIVFSSSIFLMACESGPKTREPYPKWQDQAQWTQFKQCFIKKDGRVIDTWQSDGSHSEGQGYGMLLATAVHDKETFDQLWLWTQSNLQIRDDDLMVWRWQNTKPFTPDMNNATDGDLLIAWALIRAGEIWREQRTDYLLHANKILTSLAESVVKKNKRHFLLPAAYGFEHDEYYVVNLSYYVYPALFDAARLQVDGPWRDLLEDGLDMLKTSLSHDGLPTDWNRIDRISGKFIDRPYPKIVEDDLTYERFGYEAIRIPLYSCWINGCQSGFDGLKAFWREMSLPPAWIDLSGGEQAEYPLAKGGMAIRDLLLEKRIGDKYKFNQCNDSSDYYNSVLSLLSQVALNDSKVFDL